MQDQKQDTDPDSDPRPTEKQTQDPDQKKIRVIKNPKYGGQAARSGGTVK